MVANLSWPAVSHMLSLTEMLSSSKMLLGMNAAPIVA